MDIDNTWLAFCFDEAAGYIAQRLREGATAVWSQTPKVRKGGKVEQPTTDIMAFYSRIGAKNEARP
jgi:hypothetical protein